jgi:pimeloyl-ACP methyl ester carboxylesterase/DNA-binding SARP family transcriptional activator
VLEISVLGGLAVRRDGACLELPRSRKTRALLAYLVVTGRCHRRDRLCSLLWTVPDDPRAALRWSLSRLRPLVDAPGAARIVADRESVAFDRDQVAVDVLALRGLLHDDLERVATETLRRAAEALEGDFLAGLDLPDCQEFQAWCLAEREEARRLRARLLAALVARLATAPEEALPHARAHALLEPADEAAQAGLVRLLWATGRWREAEQQFQAAERRLAEFHVVRTGALRQAWQHRLTAGAGAAPALHQRSALSLHDVRFCHAADGVRIAYASVGNGPPLVWAAHWLSHLAFSWESPIWRHWTQEFARDRDFIHYDERGNGLSDWASPDFSLDAFVRDLEAVVDALGLERFALIGSSKGGPTAIAYAARHPERVSRLVLYGAFAQGWRVRGDAAEIARREALIALMRHGWAQDNPAFRQVLTSLLLPDATREEMGWFNDLQRIATSAENAARLQRALGDLSVVDLLPEVAAPTLVLHCRDDNSIPFSEGELIARRIPRARFVPLEGRNHVLLERDPAWEHFVREVRGFLGEARPIPRRITARASGVM